MKINKELKAFLEVAKIFQEEKELYYSAIKLIREKTNNLLINELNFKPELPPYPIYYWEIGTPVRVDHSGSSYKFTVKVCEQGKEENHFWLEGWAFISSARLKVTLKLKNYKHKEDSTNGQLHLF